MSLHALYRMADAIERLAFQMPAPNQWTPQFVALAVAAREQANELRRASALAGGGEPDFNKPAGAVLVTDEAVELAAYAIAHADSNAYSFEHYETLARAGLRALNPGGSRE